MKNPDEQIERYQLARITDCTSQENQSLREQLAAVEHDRNNLLNQNVMLREALERFAPIDLRYKTVPETFAFDVLKARKALAATDDLDGLILCEREPRAAELMVRDGKTDWRRYNVYDDVKTAQWHADKVQGPPLLIEVVPLYRPRRPE